MLNHLALGARDPERLARFYEEQLGLSRCFIARDERGTRAIWFDLGASSVLMIERAEATATDDPAEPHPAAQVPIINENSSGGPPPAGVFFLALTIDPERLADREARLVAAGVKITHRTDYTIYFRDPEGNRVGLSWFNAAEYLS